MTVTHEQLHAEIATLRAEVASIRELDSRHNSEIISINGRLSAGQASFGEIKALIATATAEITNLRSEVKALAAAENQRQGRDGVWAAIVRSPFVAWVTAAGTAIAGFFAYTGKGP